LHPERPDRLLAARLLAADLEEAAPFWWETTFTNVYFQMENGKLSNYHIRTEYATNGPQLHRKYVV
jgi:hypothetical protein